MSNAAAEKQVSTVLDNLSKALEAGDIDGVSKLFLEDCYWRDLVTFTWNIHTMEGHGAIRAMLSSQLSAIKPSGFALDPNEAVEEADGVISAWIRFETGLATGYGHIRLKDGKIWTLLTTMQSLKGFEEPLGKRRLKGTAHGHIKERKTWAEEREEELETLGYSKQPYVVIIGGGQGGIAMGARLRQLGVPTIIIERNERAGDSWRKRYKSLCLHDPIWYDHLPYLPFPDNWPVFAPKDKIGDWLEMYTKVMELNYWSSSNCTSATYNEKSGEWTVVVDRNGEEVVLKPKQLVLATGMSGKARVPELPGMDKFKGDQHHSSKHPGPDAYKGKKAVIIGSNNSAHDIAAALWENGADVTMVQRSSTHIVKSETLMTLGMGPLYSEEAKEAGMTTAKADLTFASVPYRLLSEFHKPLYAQIKEHDAEFYTGLEKAGFELDFGDDESGLFMKYLRRGSGYYIDVGASDLVVDGSVKLKHGQITEVTENGIVLDNGEKLDADLIVYATGYNSMNGWAADLMGQDVADRVGKCWGLGSDTTKDPGPWEGELRNMWKPTQQPGLWFHGGNLHQSRHYSQFLSLQLKARMEGLTTPVYGMNKVYHLQ